MSAEPVRDHGVRGAMGILRENGRFLLVANRRDLGDGPRVCWDLPGGGVHVGESLAEACAREVFEETGIPVRVVELALVVERFGFFGRPVEQRDLYFYFVVERTGPTQPERDPAILDVAFATPEEMGSRCCEPYHEEVLKWIRDPMRGGYVTRRFGEGEQAW